MNNYNAMYDVYESDYFKDIKGKSQVLKCVNFEKLKNRCIDLYNMNVVNQEDDEEGLSYIEGWKKEIDFVKGLKEGDRGVNLLLKRYKENNEIFVPICIYSEQREIQNTSTKNNVCKDLLTCVLHYIKEITKLNCISVEEHQAIKEWLDNLNLPLIVERVNFIENNNFVIDIDKILYHFFINDKENFLDTYSYLSEEEYDNTNKILKRLGVK